MKNIKNINIKTYIALLLIFVLLLNLLNLYTFEFKENYLLKKKDHNYPKVRLPASPSRVKRRT